MLDAMVLIAAVSMVAGFYELWAKGPHVPKAQRKTPLDSFYAARHAEVARIARTGSMEPPASFRLSDDERLLFFIPVIFNECASTMRRGRVSGVTITELVWPHFTSSGKRLIISPVDAGTLFLTNRRFIFRSAKRRREFPLAELTHVSTCRAGIALATRGRHGIAYFTGLDALIFGIQWALETPGNSPQQCVACALNGQDVEEILQLLRTTPSSRLT